MGQGRNEGVKGGKNSRAPNHLWGRRATAWGAEKAQQGLNPLGLHFFRKTSGSNMGAPNP